MADATTYATTDDIEARLGRELTETEEDVCDALLEDAAVIIDAAAPNASAAAKKVVSCRMVLRTIGSEGQSGVPMGATQGSMSAMGYSQSWTISGGGSSGELYLSKTDRRILGCGNAIGSYSPVQELVPPPPAEVIT